MGMHALTLSSTDCLHATSTQVSITAARAHSRAHKDEAKEKGVMMMALDSNNSKRTARCSPLRRR